MSKLLAIIRRYTEMIYKQNVRVQRLRERLKIEEELLVDLKKEREMLR